MNVTQAMIDAGFGDPGHAENRARSKAGVVTEAEAAFLSHNEPYQPQRRPAQGGEPPEANPHAWAAPPAGNSLTRDKGQTRFLAASTWGERSGPNAARSRVKP